MQSDEILVLEGVYKRVENQPVLRGVNLRVSAGEVVLVRGRSGVGKTTLARIAALLERPDEGRVLFLGVDVAGLGERRLARLRLMHIGYIDQHYRLIPSLTVLENAALPLMLMGVPRGESLERAREVLEALGLGSKIHRYPGELSGGERQRVAIARALVKKPRLIVGDEPLSNIDEETGREVLALIRSHVAENRAAALLTTTDLYAPLEADKDLILAGGRLAENREATRWRNPCTRS